MHAQHASSPIRGILLILASIAAAFLALTMVAPSTASAAVDPAADTAASNPVDDIVDATTPFIVDDGIATPYFDDEAAIAAGASDDVLTAGAAFDALIAARADVEEGPGRIGSERDDLLTPSNGFPVWGNWCGPGHGGGPAVDTLDRLCQRHDLCYAERGYFDCYCDAQLKAEIDRFSHQMTSGERAMAAAVKMVFSTGICNPF